MSVRPFSERAWFCALSFDALYPSNVNETKRVQDRGSIRESIPTDRNDLFNVTERTTNIYGAIVVRQCVARQMAFCAIGVLVAPVGVVWHGLAAAGYGVTLNRDKSKEHGKAACSDALMAIFSLVLAGSVYGIYSIFSGMKSTNKSGTTQQRPYGNVGSMLLCICGWGWGSVYTAIGSWDPKYSAQILTFSSDRTGFYKSISLKKDFGIVSQDGWLLSYDSRHDDEGIIVGRTVTPHGTFNDLFFSQGLDLLSMLKKLAIEMEPTKVSIDSPECVEAAILDLKARHPEKAEYLDQWLNEYERTDENLAKMHRLIRGCAHIKTTTLLSNGSGVIFNIDPYPFTNATFQAQFGQTQGQGVVPTWKDVQQKAIRELPEVPAALPEAVQAFVARLNEEKEHPPHLLGLNDAPSEDEIKRAYKQLALRTHPDRNPDNQDYFTCLFKVLSEADTRATAEAKARAQG